MFDLLAGEYNAESGIWEKKHSMIPRYRPSAKNGLGLSLPH